MNKLIARLPIINSLCLVSLYILKSKPKFKLKLNDMNVSIIVPCKNEENNIASVVNSLQPIGKKLKFIW